MVFLGRIFMVTVNTFRHCEFCQKLCVQWFVCFFIVQIQYLKSLDISVMNLVFVFSYDWVSFGFKLFCVCFSHNWSLGQLNADSSIDTVWYYIYGVILLSGEMRRMVLVNCCDIQWDVVAQYMLAAWLSLFWHDAEWLSAFGGKMLGQ